ncbi:hypothetical protein [Aidingimonas lacisalsi]|uniref:hypothetical protein n=1 Tax=Aidingimonas lacisalsi TaxID=2604086 RepID=UPI001F28C899|nr:hypothetical protein [Aidingimonas lacisalsi]
MPICRSFRWFGSFLVLIALHVQANPNQLVISQNDREHVIPVETLRQQADIEFTFHDPYQRQEITVRGLAFSEWIRDHFDPVPEKLRIMGWDGYETVFEGWDDPRWVLVTHENGRPLGLREKGPLRLVERDYGDRDPDNLRSFNDWIWMIKRIEVVP